MDISYANVKKIVEMAKRMRLSGLEMAVRSGNQGAHLGGSLSCIEIMAVLYGEFLRVDPKNPLDPDRDIFMPSKAHCVLSHIPALAEKGFFERDEIFKYLDDGERIVGHPYRPDIGFEYPGGSLGMAISVAIGMAISAKGRNSKRRFYVLLGDGELHEGSVWEAFMSAAHYGLDNLVAIIDRNRLSYDGDTEEVMALDNLAKKFESFNWLVSECDGHDVKSLLQAFSEEESDKPHVIIANTIKGKGVSFIENRADWHHHTLSQKEYDQAVEEVMNAGGK